MKNKNIYIKDVIRLCKGKLLGGNEDIILDNFSKDTRTMSENAVYVGIKGEIFDGNTLYKEAFLKGAKGCILNSDIKIDKDFLNTLDDKFIILVDDTIKCLQDLAIYKRSLYDIPVIGITGSVGKTSTKDIVASVLKEKYHVLKTEGNYNNHIGVPLTILSLKDHDCLVIEMGMNNLGEISVLSKIAKPTLAVITNVGTAHIGYLGSRENILKAKLEILDGMDEKRLIINNDNDLLHKFSEENKDNKNIEIITFGINNNSNYLARNLDFQVNQSNYDVLLNGQYEHIIVNSPGEPFILNSLCAVAVGCYYNVPINAIKKGIENLALSKNRMEVEEIKGITLINDFYNANLDSMKMAINYLGTLKMRKIAVLGDMLELGDYSTSLHQRVGESVFANKIDILITVGKEAQNIASECLKLGFNKENIYTYNSNEEAISQLEKIIQKCDAILIKASNGMHFQEIYLHIKEAINSCDI